MAKKTSIEDAIYREAAAAAAEDAVQKTRNEALSVENMNKGTRTEGCPPCRTRQEEMKAR